MCGIAALFASKPTCKLHAIRKMIGMIRHRGPDDEGYILFSRHSQVCGGNGTPDPVYAANHSYCPDISYDSIQKLPLEAALGHCRLSIIDLSPAGHQPMCNANGTLWITYNGEIYNYPELRSELKTLGRQFRTESDTEVVLHAYEEWGTECLHRFNGMFACIIYNTQTKELFAARDRFGIKPLYYWESPNGATAFASEIKQFTVLDGWQAILNGQCAYDFLNWAVIDHTSETLFSGVKQIRGGEYLTMKPGQKPKIVKWYQLKPNSYQGSFQEASETLADLLQDSIRLRLRSDVAVGSCLSGGLDSSSIVCIMNRLLKETGSTDLQKTFSACSEIDRFDESSFINHVVQATGVDAHFTFPDLEQLFETCDQMIWHQDEPFISTSIYAQWRVFQSAADHDVKVMLDGQGADEPFAGYFGFFGNLCYELWKQRRWRQLYKEWQLMTKRHPDLKPGMMLLNKLTPYFLKQPIRKVLGKSATRPDWLNINQLDVNDREPFAHMQRHSVYNQSVLQITQSHLPMLLHYEDRDSMAHSVEARTPFLDYRIVEFALSLPTEFKSKAGITKHILRDSTKGVVPEQITQRADKMTFATAEEEWMRNRNPQLFLKELKQSVEFSQGILNEKAISKVQDMISGKRSFHSLPWRLICFGRWMKQFSITNCNRSHNQV